MTDRCWASSPPLISTDFGQRYSIEASDIPEKSLSLQKGAVVPCTTITMCYSQCFLFRLPRFKFRDMRP